MRTRERCACPTLHDSTRKQAESKPPTQVCERCIAAGCTTETTSPRCPGLKSRRGRYGIRGVRDALTGKRLADSVGESDRHLVLALAEKAGEISDLKTQVVFSLDVNGVHIANYRADFTYIRDGVLVVEDYKDGIITPEYRMKRALMEACYGVRILESGPQGERPCRSRRTR